MVRALNCDFKSREFKSHYSPLYKNDKMNYKHKKYLSEDKWLNENLYNFKVFCLAQSKSCNSSEWINLQKFLSKHDLKSKLISFKNLKKSLFFSQLPNEIIEVLLKGKIVIIYGCSDNSSFSSETINKLRTISAFRFLTIYQSGRFLNFNSKKTIDIIRDFSVLEWIQVLNKLKGVDLKDTLECCNQSFIDSLQYQHKELVSLLTKKIENEKDI